MFLNTKLLRSFQKIVVEFSVNKFCNAISCGQAINYYMRERKQTHPNSTVMREITCTSFILSHTTLCIFSVTTVLCPTWAVAGQEGLPLSLLQEAPGTGLFTSSLAGSKICKICKILVTTQWKNFQE